MHLTYGVIALGRSTFDLELAENTKERAFAALDTAGINTVGNRELALDGDAAEEAINAVLSASGFDLLLILQTTFTDASMTVRLAKRTEKPVALWGFPEPRLGGRLKLNAYCGINLAAHALGKAGERYRWLFSDPDDPGVNEKLLALADGPVSMAERAQLVKKVDDDAADRVVSGLGGARISVIGRHPDGFDTCEYDADEIMNLAGVLVTQNELSDAFSRARAASPGRVGCQRQVAEQSLAGLADVDQEQLEKSFRLLCALQDIAEEQQADSLAVRCWPETFTEYGCAACGPMAMMNQLGVPSSCEADVYGSLSSMVLQRLANEPSWMADLVDIDEATDTAVLWHCGLAPISMCDPEVQPEATIHTNRRMPLLHQFPLKPGRVTLMRISNARNNTQVVIGGATVIRAPMAYTGTSGVIRFDAPIADVHEKIMSGGLEHHFSLVYGDFRSTMRQVASRLDLPVFELTN